MKKILIGSMELTDKNEDGSWSFSIVGDVYCEDDVEAYEELDRAVDLLRQNDMLIENLESSLRELDAMVQSIKKELGPLGVDKITWG